ncbi:MAG: hypothetical protein ACOYVE_12165 [Melioribacter sp.]|uniref:hypothetical protein n=1 Tax=Melioribacter sp. TaxID=2052167 RepID=UPI003BCC014E
MKKNILFIAAFTMLFSLSSGISAQSDLQIFGFYQVQIQKVKGFSTVKGDVPTPAGVINMTFQDERNDYTSSNLQQLNVFFRKEITSKLTAWVNFEYINSFSTERKWGDLNLEEAWVNYDFNPYLNIKAGYLIPKFNYMNEVKNRMPLLPYIVRPLVYETSLKSVINSGDFLPERAFLQLSGKVLSGEMEFNYSAYIGQAEPEYALSGENYGAAVTSTDTTNFKLFGGRVGFQYDNLRLGVSATFDKDNQQATLKEDVNRTRIGADLGFTFNSVFMDAEYIKVMLDSKKSSADMDKLFYYGTLGYDINDKVFLYATYSYLEDKQVSFMANGMKGIMFGAGFKPVSSVVLKLQYASYQVEDGKFPVLIDSALPPIQADTQLDFKGYLMALSIMF